MWPWASLKAPSHAQSPAAATTCSRRGGQRLAHRRCCPVVQGGVGCPLTDPRRAHSRARRAPGAGLRDAELQCGCGIHPEPAAQAGRRARGLSSAACAAPAVRSVPLACRWPRLAALCAPSFAARARELARASSPPLTQRRAPPQRRPCRQSCQRFRGAKAPRAQHCRAAVRRPGAWWLPPSRSF